MKILFTKTDLDQAFIKTALGYRVQCVFEDVIQIRFLQFNTEELGKNSFIFTSINAARAFLSNQLKPVDNPVFCVGKRASELLENQGIKVLETARNAEELSDIIIEKYKDHSFVHFCGNIALDTISNKLRENQVKYRKKVIYETVLINPEFRENFDAAVFFSPSGVRSFAVRNSLQNIQLFSIGYTTEKEIRKFTQQEVFSSEENTTADLIKVIKSNLHNS